MNVLVVCAAGMSSSALVYKLREQLKSSNRFEIKVGSCASNQIHLYIHETDLILLTPQLLHLRESLKKENPNIPLIMIPSKAYGNLDVETVIKLILNPELYDDIDNRDFKAFKALAYLSKLIGHNSVLVSINQAFLKILPVTVIGSFAMLILKLPILSMQTILVNLGIDELLQRTVDVTLNSISLYLVFYVAYYYSKSKKISSIMAGMNALVCFFLVVGQDTHQFINAQYLGAGGIFSALFTAFVSTLIFSMSYRFNGRMIDSIESIKSKKIIDSFTSVIPVFISVLAFSIFVTFFKNTSYGTFPQWVNIGIQSTLSRVVGNNIASHLFLNIVTSGLWFFGIHGGSIVGAITKPLYAPLSMANIAAFSVGESLPFLITSQFNYTFVFGGAGSTLGLVILMVLFSKSETLKSLGRISLPLGIFFINETILFGIPIVLNPILLIPFITVPLISGVLTYTVMTLNIIPYAIGFEIPWTTPPILSGFIQGGYMLAVWQILMLFLSMVLWFPFFRIIDRRFLKEETTFQRDDKFLPQ